MLSRYILIKKCSESQQKVTLRGEFRNASAWKMVSARFCKD